MSEVDSQHESESGDNHGGLQNASVSNGVAFVSQRTGRDAPAIESGRRRR